MDDRRIKLTKKSVADIEPVPGKQILIWDTELRGFGVRVSPGGAKAYIMQRRVDGKERRVTIARADDMPAESARRKAMVMATQFAAGIDPVKEAERRDARTLTLRDAFEAYISAPKKKGGNKGAPKKAATVADIRKAMGRFSGWLDKPLHQITGTMVRDHHAKLAASSAAQANLAHRYLRAAINHQIADADEDDEPIIKRNPVQRLNRLNQWGHVPRKQRAIPRDKLGEVVQAMQRGLIGLKQDAEKRDALLFLLLTGARLGEALGDPKVGYEPLRWQDVDLVHGVVTFRDTKNGTDLQLPIGKSLAKLLEQRRDVGGRDYVFSDIEGGVPTDLRSAFHRLESLTGLTLSAHDLRRTFITTAEVVLKIPSGIVRQLTNHATSATDAHAGYLIFEEAELRRAMEQIEGYMLSPARLADGNVVQIAEAKG